MLRYAYVPPQDSKVAESNLTMQTVDSANYDTASSS